MNLFQLGNFTLHSGNPSGFKIECDALTTEDWAALARTVASRIKFSEVYGVPTGGIPFAEALRPYVSKDENLPVLLADDVLTTGGSMEVARKMLNRPNIIGVVVFARSTPAHWIRPVFQARLDF